MNMKARKPLLWLAGEVKTPPFSKEARIEAGFLLACLQEGLSIGLPQARPMPDIGGRVLELRVMDKGAAWRIFCRVDTDAVVVVHVFSKKTRQTPKQVMALCRNRLERYDATAKG